MIHVKTELEVYPDGGSKRIVVSMGIDDAFALATVFMNIDANDYSTEWKIALRQLALELIEAGNRAR